MKLQNETRYDSRDLRGLFCVCARWHGVGAAFTAKVEYYSPRSGRIASGRGRTLRVVRPERFEQNAVDQLGGLAGGGPVLPPTALAKVCSIVEWMVVGRQDWGGWYSVPPSWANGRRVRIKPGPKKSAKLTGVAYQEAEIAKAETRLASWESKQKRAANAVKKLKREIRDRRGRIRRLQG
jgi:hypothetical protein